MAVKTLYDMALGSAQIKSDYQVIFCFPLCSCLLHVASSAYVSQTAVCLVNVIPCTCPWPHGCCFCSLTNTYHNTYQCIISLNPYSLQVKTLAQRGEVTF